MKRQRGFTLVEALIAFAILAVVLVALYQTMGTSLSGLARASRFDEVVLIAELRLAELEALQSLPQSSLESAVEGTAYLWRVEPIADEVPEPPELAVSPMRPQKVKLSVSWLEGGVKREVSVERLLLMRREPGR